MLAPTTLASPESNGDVGLNVVPPPPGATPAVSPAEAIAAAGVPANSARTEQAIPALVPAGGTFHHDTLVWVVRLDDACIRADGVRPGPPAIQCGRQVETIVDATTGEYIEDFTSD